MNLKELYTRYQPDLDNRLSAAIGDSSLPLYRMLRYHLGWVDEKGRTRDCRGGKMIRPGLCLLACESVGGDWRLALPAAAALELVHNFSLIHDDIEDNDRERRGAPTLWNIWGLAQGVNAGDSMHTAAHLALLDLEQNGVDAQKILRAIRLLDEACLRLCEGQYFDMSFEDRMDIGVEDYFEMIAGKTAALFSCSLKIGAILGTDDEALIDTFSVFGRNVGMAFQITDDVLGIWGESCTTGKSNASDILKKKKTLPVLYGLARADAEGKAELMELYAREAVTEADIPKVLKILESTGARAYCEDQAAVYCQKAVAELDSAAISDAAKDDFRALARALAGRDY